MFQWNYKLLLLTMPTQAFPGSILTTLTCRQSSHTAVISKGEGKKGGRGVYIVEEDCAPELRAKGKDERSRNVIEVQGEENDSAKENNPSG